VAKTHRMPDIYRLFSSKKPYIGHSFAERDLQFKISYKFSPLCNVQSDWTAGFVEMFPTDGLVAVCCSVLQCVAVCCSVLQCVAVSLVL